MKYIHDKQILNKFINDYHNRFNEYDKNSPNYQGDELTSHSINYILDDMKDELSIIMPNPSNRFKLIIYEPLREGNICYYTIFNNTKKVQQHLKKSYKEYFTKNKDYTWVYHVLSYDKLIKDIYTYEEEKISKQIIHLKDGTVFNNEQLEFQTQSEDIPVMEVDLTYKPLTEKNKKILKNGFNLMFKNEQDYKQFLYYILCLINKKYGKQSIFFVSDDSGVGKNARIEALADIQLCAIPKGNTLKETELYNVMFNNAIAINESQGDNNISGDTLNILVDSSPTTLTRKGRDSITVDGKDKPAVSIMGEALPYIKHFSNGTQRRSYVVPRVSEQYRKIATSEKDKVELNDFFGILHDEPTQVLEFYCNEIKEYNIINEITEIKEIMRLSPQVLETLIEDKETIFTQYFNIMPSYNNEYEECRVLIDKKEGLSRLLEYINDNYTNTNKMPTDKLRRKYLNNLIKSESGVNNIKEFGRTTEKARDNSGKITKIVEYFYAYSLTKDGVDLVNKINREYKDPNYILTITKTGAE